MTKLRLNTTQVTMRHYREQSRITALEYTCKLGWCVSTGERIISLIPQSHPNYSEINDFRCPGSVYIRSGQTAKFKSVAKICPNDILL